MASKPTPKAATSGKATAAPEATTRTTARQQRSQVTFEAILAAAGALLDEVGIDATTMDAVARRAGVSIGAVYRFFENRDALVATLTARFRDALQEASLPLFEDESLARAPEAVIADFLRGFRRAIGAVPGSRGLLVSAFSQPTRPEIAFWSARVDRFIQRYAPGLAPARRREAASTFQVVTAALMVGVGGTTSRIAPGLDEARAVLVGYTHQLAREAAAR
jgi:AcrR family transcriptional regulator